MRFVYPNYTTPHGATGVGSAPINSDSAAIVISTGGAINTSGVNFTTSAGSPPTGYAKLLFLFQIVTLGTSPQNISFLIEGSPDNTNWFAIQAVVDGASAGLQDAGNNVITRSCATGNAFRLLAMETYPFMRLFVDTAIDAGTANVSYMRLIR